MSTTSSITPSMVSAGSNKGQDAAAWPRDVLLKLFGLTAVCILVAAAALMSVAGFIYMFV